MTSCTKQLKLDYGKGILTSSTRPPPRESAAICRPPARPRRRIFPSRAISISAISSWSALDGKPLATSGKMLLQVMSEDMPSHFRAEPAGTGLQRIVEIGRDPWLVKNLSGIVKFKRADAGQPLKVTALDFERISHEQSRDRGRDQAEGRCGLLSRGAVMAKNLIRNGGRTFRALRLWSRASSVGRRRRGPPSITEEKRGQARRKTASPSLTLSSLYIAVTIQWKRRSLFHRGAMTASSRGLQAPIPRPRPARRGATFAARHTALCTTMASEPRVHGAGQVGLRIPPASFRE